MAAPWAPKRNMTDEQVLEIRRRFKEAGGTSQGKQSGITSALAKEYGKSVATISDIVNRRTYKHLGGYR